MDTRPDEAHDTKRSAPAAGQLDWLISGALLALIMGVVVILALTAGRSPGSVPSFAPGSSPAVALSELSPVQLAVASALSYQPAFAGAVPYASESGIAQRVWYKADTYQPGAITVVVGVGFGDCVAGCMSEHRWTYLFGPGGQLYQSFEIGDALPPAASPGAGPARVTALLLLGPACPFPPVASPVCANMPIGGVTLRARSLDDPTNVSARADPRGLVVLDLPAGRYLLTAEIGPSAEFAAPAPIVIRVAPGGGASLRIFFSH